MKNTFLLTSIFVLILFSCTTPCEKELETELSSLKKEYQELLTEKVRLEAQVKAQEALAKSMKDKANRKVEEAKEKAESPEK